MSTVHYSHHTLISRDISDIALVLTDGECKARLWQPDGGERGDGRGGILEGYTNLVSDPAE